MGFNEYMTALYQRKLLLWESAPDKAALYEARQYLRYVEDLTDEGYAYLENALESAFNGMSRLRALIAQNGGEPFSLPQRIGWASFGGEPTELSAYLNSVAEQARSFPPKPKPRLLMKCWRTARGSKARRAARRSFSCCCYLTSRLRKIKSVQKRLEKPKNAAKMAL